MLRPSPRSPELACDRCIRLGKRIEYAFELLRGHADAGVSDGDHEAVGFALPASFGSEADQALFGEFRRIAQQVEYDLAQPGLVEKNFAQLIEFFKFKAIIILGEQRHGRVLDISQQLIGVAKLGGIAQPCRPLFSTDPVRH